MSKYVQNNIGIYIYITVDKSSSADRDQYTQKRRVRKYKHCSEAEHAIAWARLLPSSKAELCLRVS